MSSLIDSIAAAVTANPDDVVLRRHLVDLLLGAARPAEALEHCTVLLRRDATDAVALAALGRATAMRTGGEPARRPGADGADPGVAPATDFDWQAAEEQVALADSVRSGVARPIGQADLLAAAASLGTSLGPWYEQARNVAEFANSGGEYDDLLQHLKSRRR